MQYWLLVMSQLLWLYSCGMISPVLCMLCQTVVSCAVAATLGATLVFPGAGELNVGGTNSHAPYLTGLGAVIMTCLLAPLVTMCCAVPVYLWSRKTIFRSEDPFHNALWVCVCYTTSTYPCTCVLCIPMHYMLDCSMCASYHGVHAAANCGEPNCLELRDVSPYLAMLKKR